MLIRQLIYPLNLYMPGLVKTKIPANEPQPIRIFVKIMNMIVGISVEKAAEYIFSVINDVINLQKKELVTVGERQDHFIK